MQKHAVKDDRGQAGREGERRGGGYGTNDKGAAKKSGPQWGLIDQKERALADQRARTTSPLR
ncbi:hypothetical protein VAWG007_19050 [Aeromonas enteropelogenes]|nr:hypothetical protein VAWG007_19050 [Aeromonas enteropelogenes]